MELLFITFDVSVFNRDKVSSLRGKSYNTYLDLEEEILKISNGDYVDFSVGGDVHYYSKKMTCKAFNDECLGESVKWLTYVYMFEEI
jgi:hypothetical protein